MENIALRISKNKLTPRKSRVFDSVSVTISNVEVHCVHGICDRVLPLTPFAKFLLMLDSSLVLMWRWDL